jgi:hypothetical protein
MSKFQTIVSLIVSAMAFQMSANAAPVYSSLTGNYYDYINQNRVTTAFTDWNWLEAKADAEARTFQGRMGHLVTLTSRAEEQILIDNWIADILYGQAIIGGYRLPSADPLTGWQWVTGESFSHTNWAPSEPNNAAGQEVYLHYQSIGVENTTSFVSYGWNDMLNERRGYFIEYPAAVSLPGTLPLVAIAGLALVGVVRRKASPTSEYQPLPA